MKFNLMLVAFAALAFAAPVKADHHNEKPAEKMEEKKMDHVHKHDKSCKHKDKEGKCEDHHKDEKKAADASAPAADPHKH
jgi:hypothetical protein